MADLITLHIMMLNPGMVLIKIILILGFILGLIFELNMILTAFTTNKSILNQSDLLILTTWRRLSKHWLALTGLVLLLVILWLPFGDAGFTGPVLNLVRLPIQWVDLAVLQRRIVVVILAVIYCGILYGFLRILGRLRVTVKPELVPINGWHRLVWFVRPLLTFWLPLSIIDHLLVRVLHAFSPQLSTGMSNFVSLVFLVVLVSLSLLILSAFLIAVIWESLEQPEFRPEFDENYDQLHSMAWFPTGLVFVLVILFSFQAFHFGAAISPSVTIAHRGVIGNNGVPNSVAALRQTTKHRPNFVEIDVQETKDRHFVVSHGQDVALKMGQGSHKVDIQKMDLKKLAQQRVDAGGQTTKLVKLSSYLNVAKQKRQRLIVELKVTPQDSSDVVKRFADQYGNRLIAEHDFVHTMSYQAVLQLKHLEPNLIVGYIVPLNLMSIKKLPADFYSLQAIGLNTTMVRQAHSIGAPAFVWTPDSTDDMQMMRALGADGQITNQLTRLQRVNQQPAKDFNWAIVENVVNQFC
ncbi:glycerophosphodiester phosphodiesterase family protein [Secundilactobacillus hailunensis]|uniref:Glycerophosphodiester phosphodiesterase family protein n=1 Tax=Secundilactobacillus hailunensis TaxID=2559923 RepID=A0ABW1TBK1_9LACO|nr:glycerophosphodiester phosphodiesterase family protein [Secundilactobacillus hailunensis]